MKARPIVDGKVCTEDELRLGAQYINRLHAMGATMADIVDPSRKIVKLRERQACIEEEIAVLQDRHDLIEHEIAQLRGAP